MPLSRPFALPSNSARAALVAKLSSSSAYTKTPGSLKLKGGLPTPDAKQKKKKTKSSTSLSLRDSDSHRDSSSASTSSSSSHPASTKTEAQKRFEQVQKKRLLEKAAKAATKTHKERVAEFNEKLENMSEHYDIPRVGPG